MTRRTIKLLRYFGLFALLLIILIESSLILHYITKDCPVCEKCEDIDFERGKSDTNADTLSIWYENVSTYSYVGADRDYYSCHIFDHNTEISYDLTFHIKDNWSELFTYDFTTTEGHTYKIENGTTTQRFTGI